MKSILTILLVLASLVCIGQTKSLPIKSDTVVVLITSFQEKTIIDIQNKIVELQNQLQHTVDLISGTENAQVIDYKPGISISITKTKHPRTR